MHFEYQGSGRLFRRHAQIGNNRQLWEIDWNKRNPQDPLGYSIPEMNHGVFWAVMVMIIVVGTVYTVLTAKKKASKEAEAAAEIIEESEPTLP